MEHDRIKSPFGISPRSVHHHREPDMIRIYYDHNTKIHFFTAFVNKVLLTFKYKMARNDLQENCRKYVFVDFGNKAGCEIAHVR